MNDNADANAFSALGDDEEDKREEDNVVPWLRRHAKNPYCKRCPRGFQRCITEELCINGHRQPCRMSIKKYPHCHIKLFKLVLWSVRLFRSVRAERMLPVVRVICESHDVHEDGIHHKIGWYAISEGVADRGAAEPESARTIK
jgi:hypothetical protein